MATTVKTKVFQAEYARTLRSNRIGKILIERGHITEAQLNQALEYQREKGGRLGWILASLGYINRLELYAGLAEHFDLPFGENVSYIKRNVDKKLLTMITHEEIMSYQAMPFRLNNGILSILTAEPDDSETLEFFKSRFGVKSISETVITDLDLTKLSEELYRDSILDKSIHGLFYRNPDESAYKVLSKPQWVFLSVLLCASLLWLYLSSFSFLVFLLFLVQLFYVVTVLFKLVVTISGFKSRQGETISTEELNAMNPKTLPVYTILLPVYKEAEVIKILIKSLKKLDYPQDKLDIILLLEEDDKETLMAAKSERPPVSWRFLTLPDSLPKTKPKALNYGLHFARGEYLTIYDAEDIPDPDQLKKAVIAFRTHDKDYVCFQAALNYFNKNENFLTRMFTLEYSYWFDCLIPGLYGLRLPIPLGGTSNHFDVRKLKQIGGWDPFNVTEDADLGMRASAEGYKVGVIDSTTYEEANSNLGNWLRQRSRWVKGYMQTFLVHNRHPIKAIKIMGLKQWFGYNLLVGGTPVNFLVNPIMWAIFIYTLLSSGGVFASHFSFPVLLYLSAFNLIFGNIAVIIFSMIGALPRKYYHLLPWAALNPVYWILQSVGAYKALWQLITKPYYWEKTNHGISKYQTEQIQKTANMAS